MLDIENRESSHNHSTGSSLLAATREHWPRDAQRAYREVLGELNRWCREHDQPMSGNTWAAEEAVRQTWADAA